MVSDRCFYIFPLLSLFFLSLLFTSSFSTSLSGHIFESQPSISRSLLQAKKACPVNFEFSNYTVITGKCKGPRYPPDLCCSALMEFACPYAEELNDLTNECASTMFSYINLYGRYPPGLFSSECRAGKEGLPCPAPPPATSMNQNCVRFDKYMNNGKIPHRKEMKMRWILGFVNVKSHIGKNQEWDGY